MAFSTFAFPSPHTPPHKHASPSDSPPQKTIGKARRILVVEDDATTSNALRQLLTVCGYQVSIVGTVAAAKQAIDESIDAVVLDLMLPDGDGGEVLRMIRSAGLPARVCVTTGVSSPQWLDRVRALGADHILQKPIDLSDLLEKLA
jgi:DNA-binding response OmpR family regulator